MKLSTSFHALSRIFADRFPIDKMSVQELLEHKEVPVHCMSWGYYTGGLTLFFLLIQAITGLLLLFYYQPTVSDAHNSVEFISAYVAGGQFVRNMHAWSSSGMILFAVVHLLTTFAMKAFEKPREITWLTGVLLLLATFLFGFTGYLLPWNQIAVNATKIAFQSIDTAGQYLPGALSSWPQILRQTFQGELSVGQPTLSRFYALHVVLLPASLLLLLGLHLLSVQVAGMSRGTDAITYAVEKFFPSFMIKDISVWSGCFFILFVLSATVPFDSFLPFPLLEPYNALGSTPSGIRPEWYFYFVYYPLELLPFQTVLLACLAALALLFATPWLFAGMKRHLLGAIAAAAAAYLVIITVFGEQIYHQFRPGG